MGRVILPTFSIQPKKKRRATNKQVAQNRYSFMPDSFKGALYNDYRIGLSSFLRGGRTHYPYMRT